MEQYWLMEERRMMWQRVRQGMLADAQAAVAESVEALRRASKAEWVAACEWNQFVMEWGDAHQWVPKFKWRFKRDALETCWRLQGCADAQWALTRVVDALAHRAWEAYNIAEMEAEEAEVEAACADAEVRRLQEADGQAPAGGDAAGRRRRRRRRQVATTPPYPIPCQIAVPDWSQIRALEVLGGFLDVLGRLVLSLYIYTYIYVRQEEPWCVLEDPVGRRPWDHVLVVRHRRDAGGGM